MKYFIGLFLFVTVACAQYPKVYGQIGDEIYANLSSIEDLKNTKEFNRYTNEIEIYVFEAQKAKEHGFMIENGDTNADKNIYLEDLRKLIKTNNDFKNLVVTAFNRSIATQNNNLFIETVNSNLLPESFENKILDYYNTHPEIVVESGLLSVLIQKQKDEQEEALRLRKSPKVQKSAAEIEREKIERFRKADAAKKEAFMKAVEKEEAQKKARIIANQKKELSR